MQRGLLNLQVGDFISSRIGAYPALQRDRATLHEAVPGAHGMMHAAVRSRLWTAIMRWAIQADLEQTLPPGLELWAFAELSAGNDVAADDCAGEFSFVSAPVQALLPVLDQALADYDGLRTATFPARDEVLHAVHGDVVVLGQASARSERARALFGQAATRLKRSMPRTVLRLMEPAWMMDWSLHATQEKVCALTPRLFPSRAHRGEAGVRLVACTYVQLLLHVRAAAVASPRAASTTSRNAWSDTRRHAREYRSVRTRPCTPFR